MIKIDCIPVVTSFNKHFMAFYVELIHSTFGKIGNYSVILGRNGELRFISGYNRPDTDFDYDSHKEVIIENCKKASKAIWES